MALKTLGTSATNSLNPAVAFLPGYGSGISAADWATLTNAIKNDQGNAHEVMHEAFSPSGRLLIPNRGYLNVLPGDWVGVDANGWPILVSAYSIATGGWTHS